MFSLDKNRGRCLQTVQKYLRGLPMYSNAMREIYFLSTICKQRPLYTQSS
jgi:hypothetical protein